jgi:hypothetical protein
MHFKNQPDDHASPISSNFASIQFEQPIESLITKSLKG